MADSRRALTLYVCGNFYREVASVVSAEGMQDVDVRAYPPDCGHPQRPERLRGFLSGQPPTDGDAIVMMGGCFRAEPGEDQGFPPRYRVHKLDQCFYLLADGWKIEELFRDGAYVLTPGWLSGWRSRLHAWGFDRQTARLFFADSAASLVLLDSGVDGGSAAELAAFSDYVDRPAGVVTVGLDHCAATIRNLVLTWRLDSALSELRSQTEYIARSRATQMMVLDLMAGLTHVESWEQTVEQIFDLFSMLFAPERMTFASVLDGRVTECRARPEPAPEPANLQPLLDEGWDQAPGANAGLRFRISHRGELLGLLELSDIAFPEYKGQYMSLIPPLTHICGLGLANARMYHDIRQLASTDPLTGLMNRRRFFELAEAECARARRYERPLAMLMLDLDHFKNVNDLYGHQAGDMVLSEFARLLRAELRSTDVCARYGGEEFVVLMPETGLELASQVAGRIRQAVADEVVRHGEATIRITVSIGVATRDADCVAVETLIDHSDRALYAAKQAGRDLVRSWPVDAQEPGATS